MARIELKGLGHRYAGADEDALRPTDLVCEHGETYALLGPSGCGKTTLLNAISGLIEPTSGRIRFDGIDVTERATRERNVAQVFQFPIIYDTMSVFDNLAFPLRNRGLAAAAVERRVREIAVFLDLEADLARRARRLSAGAKQRVSLGRGLVREDVAAILLDEPLTVVDGQSKGNLRRKLREVHSKLRPTVVYVTHDQSEALTVADRVVVMNAGRIVQVGTPRELFENPAHTFVARFIGNPGMNLVACELEDGRARVGGWHLDLPAGLAAAVPNGQPLTLGVRPERARLSRTEVRGAPRTKVTRVEDFGRHHIVSVRLAEVLFKVKLDDGPVPAIGDTSWLTLPPANVRLFAAEHAVS